MNVPEFLRWRKEWSFGLYMGCILVLTAVAAFGFGRLSATEPLVGGLRIVYGPGQQEEMLGGAAASQGTEEGKSAAVATSPQGQVVASKSGTKYHLLSCPGAATIKEENKLYFANAQEAQAAGYEPAANCKELTQ